MPTTARPVRRRADRDRGSVPFALALGREGSRLAGRGRQLLRVRRLQASLAAELARLDAACWNGALGPRALARFQELRAALTRIEREIEEMGAASRP